MTPREARERPRHWHAPGDSWLVVPTRHPRRHPHAGRTTDYADAEHLTLPRSWSWGRFTFILIVEERAESPSPVPEAEVVASLHPGRRPPGARTYDVLEAPPSYPPCDGTPSPPPLTHDPRHPF